MVAPYKSKLSAVVRAPDKKIEPFGRNQMHDLIDGLRIILKNKRKNMLDYLVIRDLIDSIFF